jgi:thiamine biosynthesis lipoprotein ApbE
MSVTSSVGTQTAGHLGVADWNAIGTMVRLVVTDATQTGSARAMLAEDLAALDSACSRFREDSELIRLEASAGRPTRVSPLLAGAIRAALRGAQLTGGDVDPTVGRAMEAIGYDRDFALVPAQSAAIRVSLSHVPSWRQIDLDEAGLVTVPLGTRLDLGATAKAWAADRSAQRIAGALGCGVLVSLGGDIAVSGAAPQGGWPIRVQDVTGDPDAMEPDGPTGVIAIQAGGLATSSTTARRWQRGGDVLHHILDPRSGRPAESVWRTVSVAAGSALDANIASTAAIIRGVRATRWLAKLGLPARLVTIDGTVTTIAGWPAEVSS